MSSVLWTREDELPSQIGKRVIVTGATSGIGFETSLAFAKAGATIILAGRNDAKGKLAVDKIKALIPDAKVSFGKFDLESFASVKKFSEEYLKENPVLDILINNAGIMAPPSRLTTSDGNEIQLQTNHLSHFALTSYLITALRKATSPRVINVSSFVARHAFINFEDIQNENDYSGSRAYFQSKLANLLFTAELQRKSIQNNWKIAVISAHPGISETELFRNGPGDELVMKIANALIRPFFSQSAFDGALPILYAATADKAEPGGYYGPNEFYEWKGSVSTAYIPEAAKDVKAANKLWDLSVDLTNTNWS